MATVSTRATAIGWHELIARDVERAMRFYTELLGWEIEVFKPGEADYPMLRVGGRTHGGFLALDRPAHWLVYVEVTDLDGVVERVPALGGHVFHGPETIPDVGRYAVLGDPQGAVFAAIAPVEATRPSRDVFTWDELLTTGVDGAKRFYGELLGWTAVNAMPGYDVFRSGDLDVAGLMEKPPQAPVPAWTSYVRVDDLDATLARARELGATVALEPLSTEGVGRWSVVLDPVGAAIGLHEPQP